MPYLRRHLRHPVSRPPEHALLSDDEIASDFNGGDFAQAPWFEEADLDEYFASRGFPRARRETALAGLKRLYPPEVCRDLLRRPWHGGLVFLLFKRYIVPHIFTQLRLGLDVMAAEPWRDTDLLARLRNRNHFAEAWNELEVWANAREAALDCEREPPTSSGKKPDFVLRTLGANYILEVKLLDESDQEAFASELLEELEIDIPIGLFCPGRQVIVRASAEYSHLSDTVEGLDRLDRERTQIRDALRAKYNELVSRAVPLGVHAAGRFALIEVVAAPDDAPRGVVDVDYVSSPSPERRVVRARRIITRAFSQLPAEGTGIALIRAKDGVDPEATLSRVAAWAGENVEASRGCKIVVLRGPARLPDDKPVQAAWMMPLNGHRISTEEAKMLMAIARPRHPKTRDPWGA